MRITRHDAKSGVRERTTRQARSRKQTAPKPAWRLPYDSPGSHSRPIVVGGIVGVPVRHHQEELLAIRRPVVRTQPALHIGELLRLAAVKVQQPYLVALGLPRTTR